MKMIGDQSYFRVRLCMSFYGQKSIFSLSFAAELFVEQQKLKLDDLRPSTDYQFTIVAESQAGIGQVSAPISFRTLDRQRVDFTIDQHENETCFDDQTCSISWTILSDGGAPIIRSEITYGLVKDQTINKNYFPFDYCFIFLGKR